MVLNLFKFLGASTPSRSYASPQTSDKIKSDFATIAVLLQGKQPSQLRQALITADKALDNALRDVVSGETMGERLKSAKGKYDDGLYSRLWSAHKMRNALVHEAGYEPPYHMILQGIEDLKAGLRVLGVMV